MHTRHSLNAIRVLSLPAIVLTLQAAAPAQSKTAAKASGKMETVARFYGAMPTGVTVSHKGRIFVNFPRWGDPVKATVVEVKKKGMTPYPPGMVNGLAEPRKVGKLPQSQRLVSVQSVVVDPNDRLWILDTGSVKFGPVAYGGPKLVGVNLRTNRVFKKIMFPSAVALKTTYLNDIRFDLRRGRGGMAFITDSSGSGPNGIIVVDLDSGKSWRKLHDHPSTKAEPDFVPKVEGRNLMQDPPGQSPKPIKIGADGIAISADGERLYYCPLASRKLYSVSIDALVNRKSSAEEVSQTVKDHGVKGASDGLESDNKGHIYVTDYERNAIYRRVPEDTPLTLQVNEPYPQDLVVQNSKLLWPDTLSVARNGYLYFTANQLHRQPQFHDGKDLRRKPYLLCRVKIDAGPVLLRPGKK